MIRNIWSIMCKDILTDQETNAVSYIQSLEEGMASVLPITISPVSIGTFWEKDSDKEEIFSVRIIFVYPSGVAKQLLQTKDLVFSRPRQRLHFKMEGLNVTEFGRYEVRIDFMQNEQWYIACRLPLMIRKAIASS